MSVELRPRRPGESSYRLLTQSLREQVYRDEYPEGQALPTELALVREHGLSRQTVRRAYQDLVAEGLVYRVRGRGTFVIPHRARSRHPLGSIDDLMKLQLDTDFELVEPLAAAIDSDVAQRLHLAVPMVHSLTFLRLHQGGDVFCRTRVYLPPRIGRCLSGVRELSDPGLHARVTIIGLIASHGHDVAEAEQLITAKAAEKDLADHLGCAPGIPILHVERTYLDRIGEPLEYAVSDFLPARYSYRSRLTSSVTPSNTSAAGRGDTASTSSWPAACRE